jgi:TRAP transporter TAXI family solute receptor
MIKRLLSYCSTKHFITALVAGVVVVSGSPASSQQIRYFQIATGSSAGTYFPIGAIIASGLSNPRGAEFCGDPKKCGVPGLLAVSLTTQGSVDNVNRIADGEVESGFSQADIAHAAYTGTGRFEKRGPVENIRVIARLYTEALHVVTRQGLDIKSLADLKGGRVSIGLPGSGTAVDAELLLQRVGIKVDDIAVKNMNSGAAADALQQGRLDAFFAVTGVPSRAVESLALTRPIRLLPIDGELRERWIFDYPFYTKTQIPDAAYPGIPLIETVGVSALWLVSSKIDEELVYQLTRRLWNDNMRRLLDNGHPKGRTILLKNATDGIALPLHDGARRFYKEKGLVD